MNGRILVRINLESRIRTRVIGMQIRNTDFKGPTGQVSQPESGTNGCELIRAINKFNIAAAFSLPTSKAIGTVLLVI